MGIKHIGDTQFTGQRQAENFLEATNDNFWHQHTKEWTHLRETDHPSRLDLIFTKSNKLETQIIWHR